MKNILFITGKLAEKGLRTVIESIENKDFNYEIRNLNVNVAALLTTEMIERRIGSVDSFDEIIIPGRVRGDIELLIKNIGKKIIRGPDELKDLPTLFGAKPVKYDLSKFETSIFGEITDALNMTVEEVIKRAEYYRLEGADVIDIGCLPNKKFPHLEEIVQELKNRNFYVSIDSHNTDELIRGSKAGADYLLSIKDESYHILENLDSYPVLIPTDNNMKSFYKLIDRAIGDKLTFIADPILDPISYGFTKSIERYIYLREAYPDIHIMIGIGNITELTHADTSGINMIMLGIVEELKLNHILTTQVSRHCSTVIRETDLARRIIHAASENNITPKHINDGLLINHGHKDYAYTSDELIDMKNNIKDKNYRIYVSDDGIHLFNKNIYKVFSDPYDFYEFLEVDEDSGHSFYLGVELARAQIAYQLRKEYLQDEELDWGCLIDKKNDSKLKSKELGPTFKKRR
tara:strand:- start:2809 stop:4191 length:1383 start_codon:yes stop_codon:yes gene_type:complete